MRNRDDLSLAQGRGRRRFLGGRLEVVPARIWCGAVDEAALGGAETHAADMTVAEVRDAGDPRVAELPEARRAFARRALSRGDRGFFLRVGDELAGWWWVTTVTYRDSVSGVKVRLQPGDVYSYDLWIERGRRGIRRALVLVDSVARSLIADPTVDRMFALIELDNDASTHLCERYGMRPIQTLTLVRAKGRIGWLVPWSCRPRRGPASRRPLPSGWAP